MSSLFHIIIFLLIASPVYSQTNTANNYPVAGTDYLLTVEDGTVLDCSKFIPQSGYPGGFPAVIFLHGFGGSKDDVIPFARILAAKGYCTFAYSMRGQGNSTGCSYLISRTEMYDLLKVIESVKNEPMVNQEKVALIGSSQGGILSFMASSSGAGIRCAVADLASPEFASSWIENGCIKMTLFWSLNYDSAVVRYSPEAKNFKRWILSAKKDKWDSLAAYLPARRDFLSGVNKNITPILISNAWQDKFFNTLGMIRASYVMNSPFKMYFGTIQGHGSDTVYSETIFHSRNIESWLDYWLYGADNGIMNNDKFTFTSGSHPIVFNHWTYERSSSPSWPPEGTVNLRLYFQPVNRLDTLPDLSGPDTVSLLNDVRDKRLTMEEAIRSAFAGYAFNSKFNKTYIYFETGPLASDIQLVGTPMLNLLYSSTANICQYNFQIWEVMPDGEMNFVTRINFTDRHCRRGIIKHKWINGVSYSHLFRKGFRIRVYVTDIDNGPADNFLGTNPNVLPVLTRARNYIHMNKDTASYIELPVIYR